jgi:hypothetical protein
MPSWNLILWMGVVIVIALLAIASCAAPSASTPSSIPTSASASASASPSRSASASAGASGIALVGPEAIQFRPQNEQQAGVFDAALRLAMANREDMGYPWIDVAAGTLELRAVNDRGRQAALAAQANLPTAGLTVQVTTTQASIARLDQIADDVTRLAAAGVPGARADLDDRAGPDEQPSRHHHQQAEPGPDGGAGGALRDRGHRGSGAGWAGRAHRERVIVSSGAVA